MKNRYEQLQDLLVDTIRERRGYVYVFKDRESTIVGVMVLARNEKPDKNYLLLTDEKVDDEKCMYYKFSEKTRRWCLTR